MRLTVFLIMMACFSGALRSGAQTISLNEKNTPLEKVLKEITRQTGFLFFYADGLLTKKDKVSITTNNASLVQVLNLCFSNFPLSYSIIDKTIVVKEAIGNKIISPTNNSNKSPAILVAGKVTNVNGAPLASTTIMEKGTKNATVATDDGSFAIAVSHPAAILIFSYVDKETQEIAISNRSYLRVTLNDLQFKMGDVVVIGYELIRPKEMMASASSVRAKDVKDNPLNSLAEVIQGKLAGVQISLSEGAPGADATINIRGRNSITGDGSPLYIVDGVPVENALNVLNPQDIESIYVLKDAASTAIYGARGANGVVAITTKGGRNTNGKTEVTYNAYFGVQQLPGKLDMMSPYDFVLYQWERALWRFDTSVISRYTGNMSNFDTIKNAYGRLPGYDWQEKTMGRNALQFSHNLSLSGGNNTNTYHLSIANNKQEGVLINSDYERKSVNFKFDHKSIDKFRFGFNFRYTDQRVNGAGTSDVGSGSFNRLRQYTRYRPFLLENQNEDEYDSNLDLNNSANGFNILNPLLLSEAEVRRRYNTVMNMNGYIQYFLTKNLHLRTTLGYDLNRADNKSFDDTITIVSKINQKQPLVNLSNSITKTFVNSNVFTYSNPGLLKSKHALSVLLGQEIQQIVVNSFAQEIRYFPVGITADKAFNNLQLAASSVNPFTQPTPVSAAVPTTIASFFSTLDYNYNKKYLLKFTIRADGTSIFSPATRWGYFPSASFAWRISNEKFFRSVNAINNLKLRVSYGTSGNNRIDPFSYRTTFGSPSNGGYGLNNILNGVFIPNNLGNEQLRWERIISKNIGLDADLFNNKLNITIDAYSNKSVDLLLNNAIPTPSGYTSQFQNIGATRNKGIELQLSATIIRWNNFSWNSNFNIAFNNNKVTSLGNNQKILRSSGWFSPLNFPADYILQVGRETGLMYGFINDGFFTVDDFHVKPYLNPFYPQYTFEYTLKAGIVNPGKVLNEPVQPGSPKFKDINGDGIVDLDNDRVIIGNGQPKFIGGVTQNFSYKNFDLSLFLNYSFGNDIYNANKLEFSNAVGNDINLLSIMNDRWKMIDANGRSIQAVIANTVVGADPNILAEANANAKIWFPSTGIIGFASQKFAIENGSFVRVNNVTLGYNLPNTLLSRFKISNLRFYVTANNPYIFTKYTGYDPDVNTRRRDATTVGVDYSAYPKARTFVTGVNLSF